MVQRRRSIGSYRLVGLQIGKICQERVGFGGFLESAHGQHTMMRARPPEATGRADTTKPTAGTMYDSAGPEHVVITFVRRR